jgi:hypothetical protein
MIKKNKSDFILFEKLTILHQKNTKERQKTSNFLFIRKKIKINLNSHLFLRSLLFLTFGRKIKIKKALKLAFIHPNWTLSLSLSLSLEVKNLIARLENIAIHKFYSNSSPTIGYHFFF